MYKAQLKRVRRARQVVRGQRRQLLVLELEGLTGLTFRTLTQTLTVRISAEAAAQVVETVRADLRERQQKLKRDAVQIQTALQQEQAVKARPTSQPSQSAAEI